MKKTSDGITIQKMDQEKWLIATVSLVSRYIQVMANIEVNGRDANIAPKVLNRLPASEIPVIKRAVMMILMSIRIII